MLKRIEIAVIPQDLRYEETIVQIAEALDNLDLAVSDIFNSINIRISVHTKRLEVIRTRATKLQKQLDYLQTNLNLKAVKLYSAAKYPANHTYKEYKLVVQPKSRFKIVSNKIYKSLTPIMDKYNSLPSTNKIDNGQHVNNLDIQEKLQFYYVKSKLSKEIKTFNIEKNQIKQNISSIDSLLIFNAKNSQASVNIQSVQNEKKYQIQDAPDSILQPWNFSEIESPSNYLYAPTLGEVPEMNVPLVLPHLPGVVDDERFLLDLNSQNTIAPSSVVVTPTVCIDLLSSEALEQDHKQSQFTEERFLNVQSKSSTISTSNNKTIIVNENSALEKSSKISTSALTRTNQLLPEMLPLSLSVLPAVSSPSTIPSSLMTPPAPPPPPPLPPLENEEPMKKLAITRNPDLVNPNIADDRSNLMAAIRNAGGLGRAKLKHAIPTEKSKDRWSSASIGGDLMADLHATLSLRRKGIAGSAINALVRMSSMIPPPPKPNESSTSDRNSATSECESQDDDGWEE